MGVWYSLVNWTKKERVNFSGIGGMADGQIALNPASSAIAVWYMMKNCADHIAFVGDENGVWPFQEGTQDDMYEYRDVTDEVVDEMIAKVYLIDDGQELLVEADDELGNPALYHRFLRVNGWVQGEWVPSEAARAAMERDDHDTQQ